MALSPGIPIRKITTTVVVSPELVAALVVALPPVLVPSLVPLLAPVLPAIAPVIIPTLIPAVLPALVPVLSPLLVPTLVPELAPILVPALLPTLIPAVLPALVPVLSPILVPTLIPELTPALIPALVPNLITPVVAAILPLVVSSFNTRSGAVTLLSSDVTTALGFTPAPAFGFTPAALTANTFTGLQTLSAGLTVSSGALSLGGVGGTVGFLGAAPAVRQVSGENITNNVTASGVNGTVPNIPLSNYNSDGPLIREALYQISRKLKQVNDALRLYGILT